MRPKPTVLLSHTNAKWVAEEILATDAIYAVFYQGKPIGLRRVNNLFDSPHKYDRTSFPNPAHAFRLANRLNAKHRTDQFVVMKLAEGERAVEGD